MQSTRGFQSALQTDLYQLTMAAAYFQQNMNPISTFECFVRKLPKNRGYLLFSGLEEVLHYLQDLHFTEEEVCFLQQHPVFTSVSKDFFDYLRTFRFTGEVWAVPEGTVVFPNEPLVRITAPLIEVQLIETFLLSMVNFSTMVATKAARILQAAQGKSVLEFGTRRAHGPDAGILAARNAYIAGFDATSNVEAGMRYGIPIAGTSAHSFIMAFPNEKEAFEAYQSVFPKNNTLLIDTYNTLHGAEIAATLEGALSGVRIDSGDLGDLAHKVRKILDAKGRQQTKIVVSSDLNEYKIERLMAENAPIDAFGVGTELATVKDAPSLSGVYKLVEQEDEQGKVRYVAKNSPSKPSFPGKKQIVRTLDAKGKIQTDTIQLHFEIIPVGAKPLLEPFMEKGKLCKTLPSLSEIRKHCKESFQTIPESFLTLLEPKTLIPSVSEKLEQARQEAIQSSIVSEE